ncbi:hypothetical protein [Sphingomonas sp. ID0503]|uniref:hypothetical protein n=1 Tax=Sphingomonas sp. ID0503 TaxID=3399691 RepID=UPI003AFA7441
MIHLAMALYAATAVAAVPQEAVVQHRGVSYEVSYRPQVRTTYKTVGMSVGTRPSTERCRWTTEVAFERSIRRNGQTEAHDRTIPASRVIEGSHPGNCQQARHALGEEGPVKPAKVERLLAEVIAADRPTMLADIDAAHALASAN